MLRLPFVVSELDEVDVVEVVEPIARVQAWAAKAPAAIGHRPPTVSGDPACEPVRNMDGWTVHRIKVYDATELTCTVCGETSTDGKCWHCGKGLDPAATPMVPTVSFLKPEEYEFIKRTW
jgi:hypothetical protein